MNTYTAISHHTIAYKWVIVAPPELSKNDIETLQQALADYTDTPDQEQLIKMLNDGYYWLEETPAGKLELYKQVKIDCDISHREISTDNLEDIN